jgi:hypothetical protein
MIPLFTEVDRARGIADNASTSILGMPCCQNRLAVPTWSYAMEIKKPRTVIEIGSYNGSLAVALGVHAWNLRRENGCELWSYDVNPQDERITPLAGFLDVKFRVGSCWNLEAEIAGLIGRNGVTFVLCDGGNKPRELATFAKYLKPGDVIAGHDYDCYESTEAGEVPQLDRYWPWSETKLEDGRRVAKEFGLVPFMQEHFDLAGWLAYQKPA